ncbi:MAG: OsmC family protein [Thermoleophilaceae bacterium]
MAAERRAAAIWEGSLPKGSGRLELASGATKVLPVTWASRTERSEGKTSPEELIAAAHSSCYAMQLAGLLGEDDKEPEELTVGATCTLDKDDDDNWKITKIELTVRGKVPDMKEKDFRKTAERAKEVCPVSRALEDNLEIVLEASLEEE